MLKKIHFVFHKQFLKDREEKQKFKTSVTSLIKEIFLQEDISYSTIALVFCDDNEVREFNRKFLHHDYETDIITFHDQDDNQQVEGELLISIDTVSNNSARYKTHFIMELNRVIIHGILHLCGYDDKTRAQKLLMRRKENYYLNYI